MNDVKKFYVPPTAEIIALAPCDVITTSSATQDPMAGADDCGRDIWSGS